MAADPTTAPHAGGVLVIDDSGDPKAGTKTAHVARQYLGSIGEVEGGIVAVTSLWADARIYHPLHVKPYAPAERLPKGRTDPDFRTNPQLAVDLVDAAREAGCPFRAVVADFFYGENATFEGALVNAGLPYVVALKPSSGIWASAEAVHTPDAPHAVGAPFAPADLAEIVRPYGLRDWVEQGYWQLKQELGWADFMVRADQAIRRHWHLVFCAVSCCWRGWLATGPPPTTTEPAVPADSDARAAPERGKMAPDRPTPPRPVPWPRTLRQERGWLDPWTFLWRRWRAWSNAPPPPELRDLLDAVGQGRPLDLYLRSDQTTGS